MLRTAAIVAAFNAILALIVLGITYLPADVIVLAAFTGFIVGTVVIVMHITSPNLGGTDL